MRSLKRKIIVKLDDGNYFLLNPYSGLADIIDEETRELLESGSSDMDDERETVCILKKRGHLVEEGEEDDFFEYLKKYAESLHENASNQSIHIIIPTYECNLRCPYCYEKHLYQKNVNLKTVMDEKIVDAVFEAILSLDTENERGKQIALYGGEPLQLKNLPIIEYILKKGDKLGYSFGATTNGADFYHFVPLLSEFDSEGVQITIDGPKGVHDKRRFRKGGKGTFDDIVKGIDLAVEHDIPVRIRVNVDFDNIKHVPELADFFREKGWYPHVKAYASGVFLSDCATYSPVIPQENFSEEMIDLFFKDERMEALRGTFGSFGFILGHLFLDRSFSPRFWSCSAHTSLFYYDPFGDIYPCGEALGHQEHTIGKYIPELKFNDSLQYWRKRTIFTVHECAECNLAFFCGGGCAYRAYRKTGTIYGPYCEHVKSSLKYEVPYLYHLTKKK